jgi:hypothetical protein
MGGGTEWSHRKVQTLAVVGQLVNLRPIVNRPPGTDGEIPRPVQDQIDRILDGLRRSSLLGHILLGHILRHLRFSRMEVHFAPEPEAQLSQIATPVRG